MKDSSPDFACLVLVVLCGVVQQIALGTLKFSNPTAEAVFRGLFLVGSVAFVVACRRRGNRPGFWGRWLPGLMALAATLMLEGALLDRDAQGAIFVLLLAAVQAVVGLLVMVT